MTFARSGLKFALAAAVLSLIACLAADIPTAQYDDSRTLWNGTEIHFKTSNVNSATFGKVFTKAVDGWMYAQPLYLENMAIPGRGTINVVYLATMHNTVYAMDADNPNAATIWSTSLGAPDTSVGYLGPEWGILSTPVIVREKQALYAVATNFENGHRVFRLHALDLVTGVEKFGGPVVVSGQTPGTAPDSNNGVLTFDPGQHRQRTSLAVAGNSVYITMAGLDQSPFHGWIFGYDTSTLQPTGVYCDTANGQVGGIWQSGRAPAVDANGALYFETGDGDFDGIANFGDTVLKLNTAGTLGVADWFAPDNWHTLYQYDWDLGSSGPLLIRGINRIIAGSKAGFLYVLDPTNLGHTSTGNGQIVQSFQAAPACTSTGPASCGEIHGQAFWNHVTKPTLYVWAWRDTLKAYPFSNGQLDTAHATNGTITANYPGGLLAVSSDGSTPGTGIVWAVTPDLSDSAGYFASAGTLRAFDATDVTQELWNSGQNLARDGLGNFAKFVSPVVANGKVYVATFSNQLVVYGLLPALTVSKSHIGNLARGQQNAIYTVTVSNASGTLTTSGAVTVTETAPSGLTLVSLSGTGWTCGSTTCTRSDALAGGSSYPAITVTVNVAGNATSPQVNQASVSGGGSASAGASDSTGIIDAPTLNIAKTHTGNFTQGQQNASYTVSVSNAASSAPTSGTVTVTETAPAGLTLVSMSGTGWTCGTTTCTRSDALAGGSSYPAITVIVNVAANAASPQVNQVSVSGGGSANASASASTTIAIITLEPRFFNWTNSLAQSQLNQRGTMIAGIQTMAAAEDRKSAVRAKIIQLIGGLPLSSAPLNAQITGTIDMGSYSIQKILFESMPGLIVSSLLYLPKTAGPHPAILFQIGHFDGGKAYDQTIPGNLAMKGFVVLAFDPIGEGERMQAYNPATGTGLAGDAVQQHLMAGAQSALMGQNYARYEIFDAQRAVDYLVSRPEVDGTRIGATGCSGGGTLTTYLSMLDSRIKVAAPACYINSYQDLYPQNVIGDSEQSFSGLLSSGLDEADFVELFSPKPFLICSTQQDFFSVAGAQIVYNEASQWYGLYGAANSVQWVVGPGGHGTPLAVRQAIYAWMIQWLNNNVGDSTEQTVTTLPTSQLLASSTGQVGGLQIYQVIAGTPHTPGSRADLAALLNRSVAHSPQSPATTNNSQMDNGTFTTQTVSFSTEPGLTLDAQLMIPDAPGVKPGIVFVEGTALGSAGAKQLAAAGNVVLDALPRGLPSQAVGSYAGDWITDVRTLLIGRSLPGMRAYDILQGVEILAARNDVDSSRISGVASGIPGFWLLLAAASDVRLSSIQLDGTPYSFIPALNGPVHYSLYDAAIDGFSLKFDIVDLLTALNGRPVFWTNPMDWLHNIVPQVSLLGITSSHSGSFMQGQQHATYTVTVSNAAAAMMTEGVVSVTESLPPGLTMVSMSGAGWSCGSTTCTRSDTLPGGSSYPAIAVTVNVAGNATSPQVNQASVSGGGSAGASASDSTIVVGAPNVSITKTHDRAMNTVQGQQNVQYAVTVSNGGTAPTSGTLTVTEIPDSGLTLVSMAGTGWSCSTTTCSRSDALPAGSSYPSITVTVNVAGNATSPQVNQVSVSGGGSATVIASDSTIILSASTLINQSWVASTGNDGNTCDRGAPCRTFQGAHDRTNAGGSIKVVDAADYSPVTISKAITIDGAGVATIAVASGTGITVNAGASDKVVLRNLSINGLGGGGTGIQYNSGAALRVESVGIAKFSGGSGKGMLVSTSAFAVLTVENTTVTDCNTAGISMSSSVIVATELDHVRIWSCGTGLAVSNGARITVRNSELSMNAVAGVALTQSGQGSEVDLASTTLNYNGKGVQAIGANTVARITRNMIMNNGTGLSPEGGGQIISAGDNTLVGNSTNGAPTSTLSKR